MNHIPSVERAASKRDSKAAEVIELYFTGMTQREIGERLGFSIYQVFKTLQDAKNLWHEWKLDEMDMRISGELARIDRIESEAWAGWNRSREDEVTRMAETTNSKDRGPETKRRKVRRGQSGEASFLRIALDCVDQRCKILGAYDVAKIAALRQDQQDHGNTIPQGMIVVVDTPEQANHILGYTQFIESLETTKGGSQ